MKNTFTIFILGLFCYTAICDESYNLDQSVISSQGSCDSNSSYIISWTLGETFVETINSSTADYTLTQGFQQPGLTIIDMGTSVNTTLSIEMSVYPNPTSGLIYLKTDYQDNLSYQLIDETGKMILGENIQSDVETIDLSNLPTSTYIVRVIQDNKLLKSYQVIKMQ